MADNPLKYSDFISPDDSIDNLIKQLEQTQSTYGKLKEEVVSSAKEVESALRKVNNATIEGQEKTKKSVTEADELAKAYERLTKSQSDTAKQIADLRRQQSEQNNINKLTAKLNASAEGSYNRLSAQYSLNKIELNKMSQAQRESTEAGKKLEKESKALYEEMKRLQEATGKHQLNVGNYRDALAALPGPMGKAVSGTKAMGAQFLKLMANPIVATIALLSATFMALVNAMKRSEEGSDRLNKVMTIASSILNNVLDVLTNFGIALFDTIPKAFTIAGNKLRVFVNGLEEGFLKVQIAWNQLIRDSEKVEELNDRLAKTQLETLGLKKEQENLKKEIKEGIDSAIDSYTNLGAEIIKDIKLSAELAEATAKYGTEENRILVENARLRAFSAEARAKAEEMRKLDARVSVDMWRTSFDMSQKALENEAELARQRFEILQKKISLTSSDTQARKELAQAEADLLSAEAAVDSLQRERIRRLNRTKREAFQQEKARSEALIKLQELEQSEVLRGNEKIMESEKFSLEERNKAALQNAQIRSKLLRDSTDIEIQDLDQKKEMLLISEEDYALQRRLLETKLSDDLLKINEGLNQDREKFNQQHLAQIQKTNEAIEKEETKKIELQKREIQNSFEQEKAFQLSQIDLMEVTEQEKTRLRLQAEKDRLEKILALNLEMGEELSDLQVQTMKNTIQKIQKEIDSSVGSKDYDIYSLAGMNLDENQKQAIQSSTNFAINQTMEFMQARIAASQKLVDSSQREIDIAQRRLEAEIEAQRAGYASSVETAQRELDLAKRNHEKALKEQEKAQKAQILLQTIEQASNLVTATAKIWATLGFPFAIPATAIMWGAFAAAKVKAVQATKVRYAEGGLEFLQGGSHGSGNDIPLGFTKDGKDRRAEGGEALAIIRKSQTRKYRKLLPDVINSLNKGIFEEKFLKSYDLGGVNILSTNRTDLGRLEKDVTEIRKQNERKFYIDEKGNSIETYKNLTRRYVN